MLRSHLLMRLAIINTLGAAGLIWAWSQGFIQMVYAADSSRICIAIAGLFVFAMFAVWREAFKISRLLDRVKAGEKLSLNAEKMMAKADHIFDFPEHLKGLGLLGTLVGIVMALYGIDPNGEVEAIVWQLVGGLSVAFLTTIVGWLFGAFVEVCARFVNTATVCLLEDARAS